MILEIITILVVIMFFGDFLIDFTDGRDRAKCGVLAAEANKSKVMESMDRLPMRLGCGLQTVSVNLTKWSSQSAARRKQD